MDGVLTLVSPSLTSISPINDNYCVGPTPIQVDPDQLDPKSAMVFSRAQDVDKLNLKTKVSKTVNSKVTQALQSDVFYHVVPHVPFVSLHEHPQKKGLSPNHTVSKIKHVKGVCCVNPCLSAPPVPNVPNAVIEQSVGGRLQKFWQVWQEMGANPRVISVLKEGYTLPFKQRPLLTRFPLVHSGYANPVKNRFLKEALLSLMNELVVEKVVIKSSGFLQPAFPCPQTKQKMETNLGPESVELIPQYQYLQDGNSGDNPVILTDRGMGDITGLQRHVFPHSIKSKVTKISEVLSVQSNLPFYCEKYTYHFLTIAICWCHPTHWPTLRNVLRYLKRPVSECELACPPSGHVTTLVNNLHYFCCHPRVWMFIFFSDFY